MGDAEALPSPAAAVQFLTTIQQLKASSRGHGSGSGVRSVLRIPSVFSVSTHGLPCSQLTKRTGWVRREVSGPESIADHMYRMAMMAFLLQGTSYDSNKWVGGVRSGFDTCRRGETFCF